VWLSHVLWSPFHIPRSHFVESISYTSHLVWAISFDCSLGIAGRWTAWRDVCLTNHHDPAHWRGLTISDHRLEQCDLTGDRSSTPPARARLDWPRWWPLAAGWVSQSAPGRNQTSVIEFCPRFHSLRQTWPCHWWRWAAAFCFYWTYVNTMLLVVGGNWLFRLPASMWEHFFSRPCDVDINSSDISTPTHNQISGPITWARAPQLKN
jgi:hypothetical protein